MGQTTYFRARTVLMGVKMMGDIIWGNCPRLTHRSYAASCRWPPRLLCGSCEDLKQPAVRSHVDIIFVHIQAPAQDTTLY